MSKSDHTHWDICVLNRDRDILRPESGHQLVNRIRDVCTLLGINSKALQTKHTLIILGHDNITLVAVLLK